MLRSSHAPQLAGVHSLTSFTTRLIRAASAARRRKSFCFPLLVRLGQHCLLLFLLFLPGVIGAEGLTLDLPTTPVQVAAASDGSAVANVDLSDPTKFPFSSTGKWKGYLEFLGKPGTERSLGQPDLFLPLLQDKNDMTFFNLRGQLQFDNTDVHEYNIGLGHRHMFQEWILGGYGYYDKRHTQFGNSYNQFTGGLELMSVDWAFRANGYLPENQTETILSGANVSVIRPGDQINVQIDGIVQEKALPGVDGEVGYLLPIQWKAYTAVFDETRVYAGGYHFFGENQFESVTGPRGRVEWRAYDLPVLGLGSRFMMGVEAQWDEPRGSQAFGLASLRIPFDVFSDKSKRKALKGLDRRMLQPVIRDVDVVTSEHNVPAEIVPALNQAGQAYTKAVEVDLTGLTETEKRAKVKEALEKNQDEIVHIVPTDNGKMIPLKTPLTLYSGQTLSGKSGTVRYESGWLGAGSVGHGIAGAIAGFLPSGDSFDGDRMIAMQPDTELNGLTLDANKVVDEVLRIDTSADGDRDTPGARYVANSTIMNANRDGIHARGMDDTEISDVTVYVSNSTIHNSGGDGAFVGDGASLTITDSTLSENYYGLYSRLGTIIADRITITGSKSFSVATTGGDIKITNSFVSGYRSDGERPEIDDLPEVGLFVEASGRGETAVRGKLEAENVLVEGHREHGALVDGSGSTLTITNSIVRDNGHNYNAEFNIRQTYSGMFARNDGKIIATGVEVTDNHGPGIIVNDGTVELNSSTVSNNREFDVCYLDDDTMGSIKVDGEPVDRDEHPCP